MELGYAYVIVRALIALLPDYYIISGLACDFQHSQLSPDGNDK
jgi:hypothetical protein